VCAGLSIREEKRRQRLTECFSCASGSALNLYIVFAAITTHFYVIKLVNPALGLSNFFCCVWFLIVLSSSIGSISYYFLEVISNGKDSVVYSDKETRFLYCVYSFEEVG